MVSELGCRYLRLYLTKWLEMNYLSWLFGQHGLFHRCGRVADPFPQRSVKIYRFPTIAQAFLRDEVAHVCRGCGKESDLLHLYFCTYRCQSAVWAQGVANGMFEMLAELHDMQVHPETADFYSPTYDLTTKNIKGTNSRMVSCVENVHSGEAWTVCSALFWCTDLIEMSDFLARYQRAPDIPSFLLPSSGPTMDENPHRCGAEM